MDKTPTLPAAAIDALVQAGRRMDSRGWVPATAGNLSVRVGPDRIAITRSGGHKGFLAAEHLMLADLDGRAITPNARPSAETLLHCQLYRLFADVGAVVHGHSVAGTVLSMTEPAPAMRFAGYELLKAFAGQTTHDTALDLPLFDNDQDIARLAAQVAPALQRGLPLGYLIRGHGVYVWGPSMPVALARLEGLEFLLACELERRKLGVPT
jgi:methylthioribulose-1-phosphate dehydratase